MVRFTKTKGDGRMMGSQDTHGGIAHVGRVPATDKLGSAARHHASDAADIFWRVEGSLLNLGAVRPVAFFSWNAQRFTERWARRGGLALLALVRPLLYTVHRTFATRVLHTLLRGVSQDRLDLLGEEYFQTVLKPRLNQPSVEKLQQLLAAGHSVVLVSQGLDHIMRPLANYLGVARLVANRLEFRDGLATGRLLDPVIRPRGGLARLAPLKTDGRVCLEQLIKDLGFQDRPEAIAEAVMPARRRVRPIVRPLVLFEKRQPIPRLSVRQALAGKHILLIGATGFIGKVWLVKALSDLPQIGKIYVLIRRQRSLSAQRRLEKIIEESPAFEPLHERYGSDLASFIGERVEVVEGDITQPGLGMTPELRRRLAAKLDLIINSSGLTDFNPDLRDALAINVEGPLHLLEFLRQCDHAGLLHLSTCYVVGSRNGRVAEQLYPNYTPLNVEGFDAEQERQALHALIPDIEARAETPEVLQELRQQAQAKATEAHDLTNAGLETRIRRYKTRWIRNQMVEVGMKRAQQLGWPNTYTFTKSLAESLIVQRGAGLPIAVARPSIVESSLQEPFRGWNEGVNTSAPISYLLGTYFRQLPSDEHKCLDLIPVDLVCRGMMLIAAAIIERIHEPVYQLATSAVNPCDMGRSVELTALAHRKFYLEQGDLEDRLRAWFESIPVSKERYQKLSAPGQKALVQAIQRMTAPLPLKRPPLMNVARNLDRVAKLIELYEPFILHNQQVFDTGNVVLLAEALIPEERAAFGYDPLSIDWWEYWINIHIPALRRWSYPLIEGRPLESRPRPTFRLSLQSNTRAAVGGTT